jgi:hypothetical protein
MALMCAPGITHAASSTGSFELVAVTTMSAPSTASLAVATARAPVFAAKALRFY